MLVVLLCNFALCFARQILLKQTVEYVEVARWQREHVCLLTCKHRTNVPSQHYRLPAHTSRTKEQQVGSCRALFRS